MTADRDREARERQTALALLLAPTAPAYGGDLSEHPAVKRLRIARLRACDLCGQPAAEPEQGPTGDAGWHRCPSCLSGVAANGNAWLAVKAAELAGLDLEDQVLRSVVARFAHRYRSGDKRPPLPYLPRFADAPGARPSQPIAAWSHWAALLTLSPDHDEGMLPIVAAFASEVACTRHETRTMTATGGVCDWCGKNSSERWTHQRGRTWCGTCPSVGPGTLADRAAAISHLAGLDYNLTSLTRVRGLSFRWYWEIEGAAPSDESFGYVTEADRAALRDLIARRFPDLLPFGIDGPTMATPV